eukprot:GHVL01021219.1.p1 GENE.GHVL01021219.1~~GHVL01021219.1.p1  ORF type:complete len:1823 (+),score=328.44 GHVL01021219.1:683-6151(+)
MFMNKQLESSFQNIEDTENISEHLESPQSEQKSADEYSDENFEPESLCSVEDLKCSSVYSEIQIEENIISNNIEGSNINMRDVQHSLYNNENCCDEDIEPTVSNEDEMEQEINSPADDFALREETNNNSLIDNESRIDNESSIYSQHNNCGVKIENFQLQQQSIEYEEKFHTESVDNHQNKIHNGSMQNEINLDINSLDPQDKSISIQLLKNNHNETIEQSALKQSRTNSLNNAIERDKASRLSHRQASIHEEIISHEKTFQFKETLCEKNISQNYRNKSIPLGNRSVHDDIQYDANISNHADHRKLLQRQVSKSPMKDHEDSLQMLESRQHIYVHEQSNICSPSFQSQGTHRSLSCVRYPLTDDIKPLPCCHEDPIRIVASTSENKHKSSVQQLCGHHQNLKYSQENLSVNHSLLFSKTFNGISKQDSVVLQKNSISSEPRDHQGFALKLANELTSIVRKKLSSGDVSQSSYKNSLRVGSEQMKESKEAHLEEQFHDIKIETHPSNRTDIKKLYSQAQHVPKHVWGPENTRLAQEDQNKFAQVNFTHLSQMTDLQIALEREIKSRISYEDEILRLRDDLTTDRERCSRTEVALKKIHKLLKDKSESLENNKIEMQNMEEEIDAKNENNDKLKTELSKLAMSLSSEQKLRRRAEEEIKLSQTSLSDEKDDKHGVEQMLSKTETLLKLEKQARAKADQLVKEREMEVTNRVDDFNKEIAGLKEKISLLEKVDAAKDSSRKAVEDQMRAFQMESIRHQEELTKLRSEKIEKEVLQKDTTSKLASKEMQLKKMESKCEELEVQEKTSSCRIAKFEKIKKDMLSKTEKLKKDLTKEVEEKEELSNEVKRLIAREEKNLKAIEESRTREKEAYKALETLKEESQSMQEKVNSDKDKLSDELKKMKESMKDKVEINEKLTKENESLKKDKVMLEAREMINGKIVLQTEEQRIKNYNATATNDLSIDEIKNELRNQERLIDGYQKENERLVMTIVQLKNKAQEDLMQKDEEIRKLVFKSNEEEARSKMPLLYAPTKNYINVAVETIETADVMFRVNDQALRKALEECEKNKLKIEELEEELLTQRTTNIPLEGEPNTASSFSPKPSTNYLLEQVEHYAKGQQAMAADRRLVKEQREQIASIKEQLLQARSTIASHQTKKGASAGLLKQNKDLTALVAELQQSLLKRQPKDAVSLILKSQTVIDIAASKSGKEELALMKLQLDNLKGELQFKDDDFDRELRELRAQYDTMKMDYEARLKVATGDTVHSAITAIDSSSSIQTTKETKTTLKKEALLAAKVKHLELELNETKKFYWEKMKSETKELTVNETAAPKDHFLWAKDLLEWPGCSLIVCFIQCLKSCRFALINNDFKENSLKESQQHCQIWLNVLTSRNINDYFGSEYDSVIQRLTELTRVLLANIEDLEFNQTTDGYSDEKRRSCFLSLQMCFNWLSTDLSPMFSKSSQKSKCRELSQRCIDQFSVSGKRQNLIVLMKELMNQYNVLVPFVKLEAACRNQQFILDKTTMNSLNINTTDVDLEFITAMLEGKIVRPTSIIETFQNAIKKMQNAEGKIISHDTQNYGKVLDLFQVWNRLDHDSSGFIPLVIFMQLMRGDHELSYLLPIKLLPTESLAVALVFSDMSSKMTGVSSHPCVSEKFSSVNYISIVRELAFSFSGGHLVTDLLRINSQPNERTVNRVLMSIPQGLQRFPAQPYHFFRALIDGFRETEKSNYLHSFEAVAASLYSSLEEIGPVSDKCLKAIGIRFNVFSRLQLHSTEEFDKLVAQTWRCILEASSSSFDGRSNPTVDGLSWCLQVVFLHTIENEQLVDFKPDF